MSVKGSKSRGRTDPSKKAPKAVESESRKCLRKTKMEHNSDCDDSFRTRVLTQLTVVEGIERDNNRLMRLLMERLPNTLGDAIRDAMTTNVQGMRDLSELLQSMLDQSRRSTEETQKLVEEIKRQSEYERNRDTEGDPSYR